MKFPNAFAGVKKIFTSEILSLIAAVAAFIAAILGFATIGAVAAESAVGAGASLIGLAIFGVASGILYIIAFILQIVGVSNAAKDEPAFKTALIFIIVGIVCSLVSSFTQSNGSATTISSIFSTLQQVASLGVTVFIIQGIINLADKLNNGEVSAKGATIFKIIICIYCIIIVAYIVSIFSAAIAGILTIIATVLSIVQYIVFLSFLAKAKKMLAD